MPRLAVPADTTVKIPGLAGRKKLTFRVAPAAEGGASVCWGYEANLTAKIGRAHV